MIERAFKTLALDALVIQQGRLAEQKGLSCFGYPARKAGRVNRRGPAIYVNIFSGEATAEFPSALETARGVVSADLCRCYGPGETDVESSIFHEVDWHRIVLDEAHTIKSWRTMSARAAFTLSAHCRWCLTGTPLQNNLPDLYSLLCFLHVEPWCNWAWWNKLIQRPYENGDQRALKLIKAILRPLMLRRTKETKDKEGRPILILPPTYIQVIECEQSEAERDFYDALYKKCKVQKLQRQRS
ncbi:PREDICTED: putative SWI/SNF-related matrix-associated actin-dependent regulator of chromatin subfamily A member 3-like 3 isoform X2 [Ipomoea nil]|uniref:putative SWI/SNF-related matrix-associated actin-dependent regulator of chromatin subfamily A member 3-like 3 isoform X2 n=1 Tax=Ipomoea nil TaxID=35883 RepID=UPI00090132DF|nr:PREDICTED: putative SWI/SNF-related matrix-associated actin-dependent regulator of chromatin subfamily A member 3-like 3 isoform X2 [Ipomoea nil]